MANTAPQADVVRVVLTLSDAATGCRITAISVIFTYEEPPPSGGGGARHTAEVFRERGDIEPDRPLRPGQTAAPFVSDGGLVKRFQGFITIEGTDANKKKTRDILFIEKTAGAGHLGGGDYPYAIHASNVRRNGSHPPEVPG
jgi:hypothetical protein